MSTKINVAFHFCRDAVFNYFISRVRNNLHVVLCMSPVGDAFRTRCRMFPSLVNCCTIDWFTEWPRLVQWCLNNRLCYCLISTEVIFSFFTHFAGRHSCQCQRTSLKKWTWVQVM